MDNLVGIDTLYVKKIKIFLKNKKGSLKGKKFKIFLKIFQK